MIEVIEPVMQWLDDYAKRHRINLICESDLGPYDVSYTYRIPRTIYFNENWHSIKEMPFIYAHEIWHAICNKEDLIINCNLQSNIDENECKANRFAIRLLLKYCRQNDVNINSSYEFARSFGVPSKLQYLVDDIFKKEFGKHQKAFF
ncbi:ImmA/IrrE family metallo-endopeptidase [Lactobacillus sp. ESL0679]|uniref:ImmA/IrrE family metallo-endopeptidase n=1 Tax=Lactobacillus sp. ESL0679 TaxID=2983209 RepID=UPI0023F69986|nr:ImmA/IrrE family metallo-endopeptidase [Lactobacillus sp. ESL0679]MDF7683366.1 ImmA/IrrE family metallo-endopeptidase [Lactobacillus sp. ESL0679]